MSLSLFDENQTNLRKKNFFFNLSVILNQHYRSLFTTKCNEISIKHEDLGDQKIRTWLKNSSKLCKFLLLVAKKWLQKHNTSEIKEVFIKTLNVSHKSIRVFFGNMSFFFKKKYVLNHKKTVQQNENWTKKTINPKKN